MKGASIPEAKAKFKNRASARILNFVVLIKKGVTIKGASQYTWGQSKIQKSHIRTIFEFCFFIKNAVTLKGKRPRIPEAKATFKNRTSVRFLNFVF